MGGVEVQPPLPNLPSSSSSTPMAAPTRRSLGLLEEQRRRTIPVGAMRRNASSSGYSGSPTYLCSQLEPAQHRKVYGAAAGCQSSGRRRSRSIRRRDEPPWGQHPIRIRRPRRPPILDATDPGSPRGRWPSGCRSPTPPAPRCRRWPWCDWLRLAATGCGPTRPHASTSCSAAPTPGWTAPGCTWEPIPGGEQRLFGGCIFDLDATPPSLRRFALLEPQRS